MIFIMTHSTATAESTTKQPVRAHKPLVLRYVLRLAVLGLGLATLLSFFGSYKYALDLFSHFRVHFLIASAVAALLLIVIRDRAAAVVAMLVFLGNAIGLWPQQTAGTADAATATRTLNLVTFNIWASNTDIDDVAAYLLETDADIIVLQEYWLQTKKLKRLLKARYPWQTDCKKVSYCDIALFSKEPWTKTGIVKPGSVRPPTLWAKFGTGDTAYTIASVHFDRPPSLRHKRQLNSMASWIGSQPGQVILAGDFNATPWSHAMTDFRQRAGLKIVPGYRPTWPAHLLFAQLPIDHVLVSSGITSVSAARGRFAGSDHRPVQVVLSLP